MKSKIRWKRYGYTKGLWKDGGVQWNLKDATKVRKLRNPFVTRCEPGADGAGNIARERR